MNSKAIASLTVALVVSVGLPALAETNVRIVNATTHDISITHGGGNSTSLPPQMYAPRDLPVSIVTSREETNGPVGFGVSDLHEKCASGDTEGWDIQTMVMGLKSVGSAPTVAQIMSLINTATLQHFCIRLGTAEVGCLLAEVHPDHIAYSKVSDTECAGAE
jgi:hypothetical protein